MAKRRVPAKKKPIRKASSRNGGFSLARFTLGLLILVGLGYGFLAIQEGKLVPDAISDFELPSLSTEEESNKSSDDDQAVQELERSKAKPSADDSFDYEAFDLYFTKAFDFMWPAYEANQAIIERPYYTIRYSEEHEQALWVAYKLSSDSLNQKRFDRTDDFRKDPRIRTGSAELSDYKGSGYDRGHLAPAADFSYDEFALSQSFYMSNMSPQAPSFNRGIWKKLEDRVRKWATKNTEIYIVTGPVLNKKLKTIGNNEVSIPEYYYKVVLDITKPEIKAIAFLMKNEKSTASLSSFVVPIDRIEELTQIDFFPSLPDELEDRLESKTFTTQWF